MERRNIDNLSIYNYSLMRNKLSCFSSGRTETHTINDIIQTRFQQLQQQLASRTFTAISFCEITTELTF
ncbi:Uncharacterised protein [Neisseria gonorrhoeae]|uniref:Uncharacterized protein n=1 Tax=Neisseria gonorrhoeae TaxID=485 RepID=A0A379B0Q5_NEIGO|nr:Uncharacterised protein [Neisseria gonorrhoeae]